MNTNQIINKNTNNIIHYQNGTLFFISNVTLVMCIYYKFTGSLMPLFFIRPIVYLYAFIDLFYTQNFDSKLHHIFILGLGCYQYSLSINFNDCNLITYPLIKTEITSIFLVLKHYIKKNSISYYVNGLIFYILFLKIRVIDYSYILASDLPVYIITKYTSENDNIYNLIFGNSIFIVSIYGLYILNIYWFLLLSNILYKKVFKGL